MSSASPEPGVRLPGAFGLRLGLWHAGIFVASGLLLVLLAYALLASALAQRDRDLVASALQQYVGQYRRGGLSAVREAVASDRMAGRHEGLFVRVLGPRAEALFASVPSSWVSSGVFEVASARLEDGTLFQVGKSTEARADILVRFRAAALLVFASSLLFAVVGGVLITRWALAPLRQLNAVLGGIVRTGRVSGRVPVRADGDPLDDLCRLFNGMLDRIEALIEGLRGSLDNVAHDLRTPLARLRAVLEGALREGEDAEALRRSLSAAVEETDRVSSTLTTLMDISEAENGAMALRRERLLAREALRESVELYADVAEEKGIALTLEAPADLALPADRTRLRQALANLVDNALKYTPRGGRVRLSARPDGPFVVFECADDGPGISAQDLPRIWDRLYRGDRSRSERGLGLGLSLVRAIARAHGGDASVESSPGQGSAFRLRLPLDA
jgi:signal transduction histidine kinase